MDLSAGVMLSHLLLGSIGFAVFIYGKKQARGPQLGAGVLLMGLPYIVPSVVLSFALGAGVLMGLTLAVRAGW
jgi:hypothetical protein